VQYVFLEFKQPEGDVQLEPGTELVLKVSGGSSSIQHDGRACAQQLLLLMHLL
jgi:hypothetical protein